MKEVELPNGSVGEFPDTMSDAAIAAVLRKQFPSDTLRKTNPYENVGMTARNALRGLGVQPHGEEALTDWLPQSSAGLGAFAASSMIGGPIGRKIVNKIAPEIVQQSPFLRRLAERGVRVLGQTLGGGMGALASGQNPVSGAERGFGTGVAGEVASVPIDMLSRSVARPIVEKLDSRALSAAAAKIHDALPRVQNQVELHKLMVGTAGEELIGTALQNELAPILKATGTLRFRIPALDRWTGAPGTYTAAEAIEEMRNISMRGYTPAGDPRGAMSAVDARKLRHLAREQITAAIGGDRQYLVPNQPGSTGLVSPVMGKDFDAAMKKYAKGREIVDVISDPRVWEAQPGQQSRLNMRALQEIVGTEEFRDVQKTLGRDAERFLRAVYRGGSQLERDIPGGMRLHVGSGLGGRPHAYFYPHFPSFAGPEAPAIARKGGTAGYVSPIVSFGMLGIGGDDQ